MKKSIITYASPKDPISEAFRNMRTNILYSDIDEKMQVLTVTSADKAEGKSTILSNYAVALAQSGRRVILIDGDLRRPRLQEIFGTRNQPGLTNVLIGEYELSKVIRTTKVANLHLITAGRIPPNPAEIIGSRQMAATINTLKSAYDCVLIDAPPLGMFTDAAALVGITDGFIVVAALGVTEKEELKLVLDNLANVGGKVIGVVANNEPMTKRKSYYYNDYYDYRKESAGISKKPFSDRLVKMLTRKKHSHKR